MNLKGIVIEAHGNSRDHGFWDEQQIELEVELDQEKVKETIPEKLMLIVSECAEALEDYRKSHMIVLAEERDVVHHVRRTPNENCRQPNILSFKEGVTTCPECGRLFKPVGFPTELADIVIRVADLAGALGIDLEAEVIRKMEYNRSRPYKHGKVC